MKQIYDPSRFLRVRSIDEAKSLILTPNDSTTEKRWATETSYLGDLIGHNMAIHQHHRVLDYGCGIGRMAKEVIGRTGCYVTGTDFSTSMRALAPMYVDSDRFFSCPPDMLDTVKDFHFCLAIWTLQHVAQPAKVISSIRSRLHPYGRLFVVDGNDRCLPFGDTQWMDDGADVREMLGAQMNEVIYGRLDPDRTTPATARNSWWGVYQRRD